MPTSNPRVNVTLSPTLNQLVDDLARMQRVSKASVLRELLEASEPVLQQVVAMMRAADEMSVQARTKVARDMQAALPAMEQKHRQALELAAGITSDLVAAAEAIKGRRPARGGDAAGAAPRGGRRSGKGRTPLPSKRGVKS